MSFFVKIFLFRLGINFSDFFFLNEIFKAQI